MSKNLRTTRALKTTRRVIDLKKAREELSITDTEIWVGERIRIFGQNIDPCEQHQNSSNHESFYQRNFLPIKVPYR